MPLWSVQVDADVGSHDESLVTTLVEALADLSAAAGASYVANRIIPDRIGVQLAIEAATLHQAQEEARRKVTSALRESGRRVHLVRMKTKPWEDFEEELDTGPPELVGMPEIAEILKVARQRVHQLAQRPDFPAPVARLKAGAVWYGATIRRWQKTWDRRAGRRWQSDSGADTA